MSQHQPACTNPHKSHVHSTSPPPSAGPTPARPHPDILLSPLFLGAFVSCAACVLVLFCFLCFLCFRASFCACFRVWFCACLLSVLVRPCFKIGLCFVQALTAQQAQRQLPPPIPPSNESTSTNTRFLCFHSHRQITNWENLVKPPSPSKCSQTVYGLGALVFL